MPSYVSIIIAILFAVYLNFEAKRYQKSRTLWTILGALLSFVATAIFMFRTKRAWLGVLWLIVMIVIGYINFHIAFVKMQSTNIQ